MIKLKNTKNKVYTFLEILFIVIVLFSIFTFLSCHNVKVKNKVLTTGYGYASWYGPNFHGKKTASGEMYNIYQLTCAHKILPFGTKVQITDLKTDKSVIVTVNDRGPFVKGRDFDLSYAAAAKIGLDKEGVAKVKYTILGLNEAATKKYYPDYSNFAQYCLQVGSFRSRQNAELLYKKLLKDYSTVTIMNFEKEGKVFHRVCIGFYKKRDSAEKTIKKLRSEGYKIIVLPLPNTNK